jgi:hypothetical protein
MLKTEECVLYSGGANGAEHEFGVQAEAHGIEEINFTFEGRGIARARGVRILSREELKKGDVSLAYVSKLMNRTYSDAMFIRKVLQTVWYQVNAGQEIYVVGKILPDGTVRGGTGWGAEFAKLCNKTLYVFDQERDAWHQWDSPSSAWVRLEGESLPRISAYHFAGVGTRNLKPNGHAAIEELYERSLTELPN